ncbi:MAG TPA: NAD-dependent epimerase/dehydratase family protein [Arenicellales bacterium]|nr:NAD-dependent epimerase/dehydratase family protein [Arenicellales bacterium]
MRVLVTGAAGFLGRRLCDTLLANGNLTDSNGKRRELSELHLADITEPPVPASRSVSVSTLRGDLSDPAFVKKLIRGGYDSIFHLASYLTLHAEKNPARAFAVNVEALRRIADGAEGCPKLVFTSSIAVFGGELPQTVDDDVAPAPTTTYGTHKAINELLIADYSRHGRIDGRALRLPIVLIRPGEPQPVISDRVAGIVREPLSGRDVTAPLAADTLVPVVSVGAAVQALIRLHDLPADRLPAQRAFNLPALSVTIDEMAKAAARHGAAGKVSYQPDPDVQAIVDGWPARFVSERAAALGIGPDTGFDAVIEDYLNHVNR